MIKIIGEQNSVFNQFVQEIRDKEIQKDSLRFRRNLERISEIFAYEVSKQLEYEKKMVYTPLGEISIPVISDQIVVASILRAGLPMHQGLLNYYDKAENAFISAFRKYHKDGTFDIQFEYLSSPEIDNKVVLLADPMLATGSSVVIAYKGLLEKGKPKHTHIISIIGSREGVEHVSNSLYSENVTIWLGAMDDELTAKAYIVPGLGDAGDLAYGTKS